MTCLVDMKIPGYDHVVFNHQERNLGSFVDMKIPRYVAAKLLLLLADIKIWALMCFALAMICINLSVQF
jgi:hypothetical protein